MSEEINQMMVVFMPTGKPPKVGDYWAENGSFFRRSGGPDMPYTNVKGFHRIEIPMPGKHTNEAGESMVVRITQLKSNGWFIYHWQKLSIGCGSIRDWSLDEFNVWKAKKPKQKVTKTRITYDIIWKSGGLCRGPFCTREDAEAAFRKHCDSGQNVIVEMRGPYEVEEEV